MSNVWTPGWVPGQQLTPFSVVTANYTLTALDRFIEIDATSAAVTVTLPTAVGCAGQTYTFKRVDSATAVNTATIATTSSQTIDGVTSRLLVFQYELLSVLSDGANWVITESNYHGKELGYAETFNVFTSTITVGSDASLNSAKIPGLSITVMGAGRLVSVEFLAPGSYNATTANTAVAATLMINASQTGGVWAKASSPETTPFNAFRSLAFRRRMMLTAGTSYTFEVALSAESGTATLYANSAWFPTYLAVIGQ